jgi:hypothetical protein
MSKKEYLGDGLYARDDGFQIELSAPRAGGDHVVYLDWSVFRELARFAERMWNVDIAIKPKAEGKETKE